MINMSNTCTFEGRLVKDPDVTTVGQGNNQYTKCTFTVACDRRLTKDQKQQPDVQTADFVMCSATGKTADVISQYFYKGRPIKVMATYCTYKKQDNQGNVSYGHIFKVTDFAFPVVDKSASTYDNGQQNSNNYSNNNYNGNQNNFIPDNYNVDGDDIPF